MKVLIVGGGASGLVSAIYLKRKNKDLDVTILEKTTSLGNKLNITGKGRCNVTFKGTDKDFRDNIIKNNRFLYGAFSKFNNEDTIGLLKELNIDVKEERGNRIFLKSDNAKDLTYALEKELKKLKVNIEYQSEVTDLIVEDNHIKGVILKNDKKIYADKCIIATGGKSYPVTGSTGSMYNILSKYGHNIIKVVPGLVPIKTYNNKASLLQGLNLKNVKLSVYDSNKKIYEDFGELLFTHFGVSGPIVLSASSVLNRVESLQKKFEEKKISLVIDLKPAITKEVLDARILRDFAQFTNKEFKNSLDDLLPQKLIPVIIQESNIDPNKKVHQITKEEREKLVYLIKNFTFIANNLHDIDFAVITCGGVDVKDISPKTMESKVVKNLYVIGEVLDIDAFTGGFNLQIAFTSAYAAAEDISNVN